MGIFIAVGSNISPEKHIKKALLLLKEEIFIKNISAFYRTKAIGKPDEPDYLNGIFEIESVLEPGILKLDILRNIENKLGRIRNGDKYSSRTIDLDLIFYNDLVIKSDILTIPAPDIYERFFIALPLAEISPGLILPDTGKSILTVAGEFRNIILYPERNFSHELKKLIK